MSADPSTTKPKIQMLIHRHLTWNGNNTLSLTQLLEWTQLPLLFYRFHMHVAKTKARSVTLFLIGRTQKERKDPLYPLLFCKSRQESCRVSLSSHDFLTPFLPFSPFSLFFPNSSFPYFKNKRCVFINSPRVFLGDGHGCPQQSSHFLSSLD